MHSAADLSFAMCFAPHIESLTVPVSVVVLLDVYAASMADSKTVFTSAKRTFIGLSPLEILPEAVCHVEALVLSAAQRTRVPGSARESWM